MIQMNPQKQISTVGGDIWHALKCNDDSFEGFGEAYFSWVKPKAIKAWKRHLKITMNLVVPIGTVRFVFYDIDRGVFRQEDIGTANYYRLTVPPRIWFGFKGLSETPSLIMNLANLPHDPSELDRKSKGEIRYNWGE